jgi:GntR family transcriptional regulator
MRIDIFSPPAALDRQAVAILDGRIPLHWQIAGVLRKRILEGTYCRGQKMPSESELMSTYNVSRTTVRQALGNLRSEGLIFRILGKGTFVSRSRAFQNLGSLQGFGSAMRELGYETHSKLLSVRTIAPPKHVASHIEGCEQVTELRRLRFLNRSPISFDVSYLPAPIGERVAQADLASRDVFTVLENDCQIVLGHADLRMRATLATHEVRTLLELAEGAPILFIERVVHTEAGVPFEYEELHYRGDAFQFKVHVERQEAGAAG